VLVTYDPEADATYVAISDAEVTETRQFGDSVSVDLDEAGLPVGVELLMAPASATDGVLSPLLAEYPGLSNVGDVLHRLSLPATA
jgi:uncharacterized protein YuzE